MRDRLVGADRPAELLAILGVGDGHLHRPLRDPGRLGGKSDAEPEEDAVVVGLGGRQRVLRGYLDAVETDRVEAAGGVNRGRGGDGDTVGAALDQMATPVGGGDEEEVGRRCVHHQDLLAVENDALPVGARLHREAADRRRAAGIPEGGRAAQLALGQWPQVALALLVGAAEREGEAGDRVGEERRGGERVAHLLEENGKLDDAEALPAPLLRQRQAGPAQLGHLVPIGLLEAVLALSQLADAIGLVAGGEEVVGGRLDRLLLVGEVEVHGRRASKA